jgi:hypothetical protein
VSATNWEDAYRVQTEAIKELRAENAALRELTSTLGAPNHINVPLEQWRAMREDKERVDWMEEYQKKLGVWPGYSYRAEIDARRKKAQR